MNEYYVYAYFLQNHIKPFYIGKGKGKRIVSHLDRRKYLDSFFYRKLNKEIREGRVPVYAILLSDLTEFEAFNYEIKLITFFGRIDKGTGCLYNTTDGGEGNSGGFTPGPIGEIRSIVTRLKLSAARKPRTKEQIIKAKLASRNSRQISIRSFNLVTKETVKKYTAIRDVELDLYSACKVRDCCKGRRTIYAGLGWEYD